MMNSEPLDCVTVVIPTHRQQPVGLAEFIAQSRHVWILNNGSVPIAEEHRAQIRDISVPWKGHGQTRQEIVSQVQTEFLFFSVDDATPSRGMLASLVGTLRAHSCDAVIARQEPYPNASPITVQAIQRWTPDRPHPYPVLQTDHVGTLYRTETLRACPIPSVPIAEDAWWSVGKTVLCDPQAVIIHSHPRKTKALFWRELQIHQELRKMGRDRMPVSLRAELNGIVGIALKYGYKEGVRSAAEIFARRLAWRS